MFLVANECIETAATYFDFLLRSLLGFLRKCMKDENTPICFGNIEDPVSTVRNSDSYLVDTFAYGRHRTNIRHAN